MSNPAPNKARCLRCNEIVVSQHLHDYSHCVCGNVSVWGGLVNPTVRATDYSALKSVEVGEDEIERKEKPTNDKEPSDDEKAIVRKELLERLEASLTAIKRLPTSGLHSVITYSDLYCWMSDVLAILRAL